MSVQSPVVDTPPSVAVVSVTYNRCEPLLVLLNQLRKLYYDPAYLDIFLVDNASTDDTVARVSAEFPEIRIIENTENSGVSAGFNRSIRAALSAPRSYKYLWLLDSDAEIEPSTLKIMVEAMQRDDTIGVAGSSVYDPRKRERLVTAGLRVDWKRGDIPLFVPRDDEQAPLLDVDLIPACSMLTRASIYSRVGLWDNRFPLYWGDTDWCARVLQAGFRVCCTPQSHVWHRDWSSVARGFGAGSFIRDHLRGALLFFLRHDPYGNCRGARHLLLKIYLRAALERLTVRLGYSGAYLDAIADLLAGRFDRSFAAPPVQPLPRALEHLGADLRRHAPREPTIVLNQIADPERRHSIKDVLARHFERVNWVEIHPDPAGNVKWSEYRVFKPGQLLAHFVRILGGFGRPDINVCDISTPLLYNFAAGRYTLILDASNQGLIERSPVMACLGQALLTVLRGFKAAYFDLPRARKSCPGLRAAIAGNDLTEVYSVAARDD